MLQSQEDEYLKFLIQAKNGDREAFNNLHRSFENILRDFTISMDGSFSSADRDDIVQEVFFRLWSVLPKYVPNSSTKTYLFGITKNVIREKQRQLNNTPMYYADLQNILKKGTVPAWANKSDSLHREKNISILNRALCQLPCLEHQAIELIFFKKLTRSKAACYAGCSLSQFKDRLYRAQKRLKKIFKSFSK